MNFELKKAYATFSKRFIIKNMKAAETRQRTMNTDQTMVSDKPPQRYPPTLTRRFPIAVATNHPPSLRPCTLEELPY
ncbi:hypothetical protein [Prevotella veroralis]|uniref:hypothetical protein n=1 Tax=Prevotella veroralis TaxID=28137 RepID=UPI001EE21FCE|nr:hypothetical protein [Prevotella veroralis]